MKITAIGEILFDIYPNRKKIGGAPLNFIYHINKFTGNGTIISKVAKDVLGKKLIAFLEENNIDTKFIQVDKLHPTGVVNVELDENKIPDFQITDDRAYDYIEHNKQIETHVLSNTDCLYFGSLAQRNEETRGTIQSLWNKEINYFCDLNIRQKFYTKEIIENSLNAANILKLNRDELKLISELILKQDFSVDKTAREVINKFDIDLLAITLGSEGSLIIKDEDENHYKAEVKKIVDTVGAGDAFASILCTGYLKNLGLSKINRLANEFAAAICTVEGAIPSDDSIYEPFKDELNDEK